MDAYFFCRDCGSDHANPADARLGHFVICLDCALTADGVASRAAVVTEETPLAA